MMKRKRSGRKKSYPEPAYTVAGPGFSTGRETGPTRRAAGWAFEIRSQDLARVGDYEISSLFEQPPPPVVQQQESLAACRPPATESSSSSLRGSISTSA